MIAKAMDHDDMHDFTEKEQNLKLPPWRGPWSVEAAY
jgi:hypothetical protein